MNKEKLINITFGNSDNGIARHFLSKYINERKKEVAKGEFVCCDFNLDLGFISGDFFKNRYDIMSINLKPFGCKSKEIKEVAQGMLDKIDNIVQKVREGYKLRIWTGNASYIKCGYYFLINKLKEIDVKIEEWGVDGESWCQLDFDLHDTYEPNIKQITKREKTSLANKWDKLLEDDKGLRVVKNGKVISVAMDYFDDRIRNQMPNEEINTWKLCGRVLADYGKYIHMEYIMDRIYKLIKVGEFKIVKKIKGRRPQNAIITWKNKKGA